MGFRQNSFARIFKMEDKGNYHVAQMSISKKNKETGNYETEWQDSFVRLVGKAHNQAKSMSIGDKGISVKIGECDVTNKYDKDKKITYTNYVIFGFEDTDGNNSSNSPVKNSDEFMKVPDTDMEELPFN